MKFNRFLIAALLVVLIATNCLLLIQIKEINKNLDYIEGGVGDIGEYIRVK